MGVGLALLVALLAIFFSLCFLLVVGVIYFEFSNSEIPAGVACPGKLRTIHCVTIGIAIVGRILQNLGICSQIGFTRYVREKLMVRELREDPALLIKNLKFEDVPVRVYQPKSPSAGGRKGVLFFHGGGWMFGSIGNYDVLCRYIAKETESVVVSVGYRLAPEHRYPAQYEDCLNSAVHFMKTAEDYGVDSSSIIISGDSAGGNLTAAVCQALVGRTDLPKPLAQVLIYPSVQMVDLNLPSFQQNRAVPILYRERAAFYMINYVCDDISVIEDVLDGDHVPVDTKLNFRKWLSADNIPDQFKARGFQPRVMSSHDEDVYETVKNALETACSPLLANDSVIRLLPKAYILTCEFDVLRDDGILYKKRLEDNGVDVTWYHVKDGFHGIVSFFDNGLLSFPSGKLAVDDIVNFIKNID
ncbi:arylacetamide deacetylase-like 4 [Spea bombifrons]|uniref:arylacetamide deacetylase-like 4 n=1 Tax=Spea bombifrons TaxID=233779 RepID=UPI0023493652|nr:arylacetamide deacetylase-like 4 [Spea bombifrons]